MFLGDGNDRWSYSVNSSVNRGSYDIVSCDLFFYVYVYLYIERERKKCMYVCIYIWRGYTNTYLYMYSRWVS